MTKKDTSSNASLDSIFEDFLHPNPNINNQAVSAMIASFPKQSIQVLMSKLNDGDICLRRKVIKALACFGKEVLDQIINLFLSTNELMIKISCLKILIKIINNDKSILLNSRFINLIDVSIKDNDPVMILTIINLLRQLGERGLPYLIHCSDDSDILRAKAAITAIGEINHPNARICLESIIQDKSKERLIVESAFDSLKLYSSNTLE